MDYRWIQGDIQQYSFWELARQLMPETEFAVRSYPHLEHFLGLGAERLREAIRPMFHYATAEEEKCILEGTWDAEKNYEDPELPYGFYFPDVPLGDLSALFPSWFCDPVIDEIVRPYYTEADGRIYIAKQILTKAVFAILHEYGHYLDYRKISDKAAMAKWIYESKVQFREISEALMQQQGPLTQEQSVLRLKAYRESEPEKSADSYALGILSQKIDEALDLIYR